MKVGIMIGTFLGWSGGIDFIKVYMSSLYEASDVEMVLMVPVPYSHHLPKKLADLLRFIKRRGKELITGRKSRFVPIEEKLKTITRDFPKLKAVFYENTRANLIEACRNEGIDILFPCFPSLGENFPLKWIGYIFDFQHKYYPDFFSEEDCRQRDLMFSGLLNDTQAVVVNSRAARDDCDKFCPGHKAKVYVTPIAPAPREQWLDTSNIDLSKYNLPTKYFIISNQFWKHKDHITAFKALALLHKTAGFDDVHMICTGLMEDYRWPTLKTDIDSLLNELGMTGFVHFTGYIPKIDQIAIMKRAVAVIQPTLFEGGPGGGSASDAIALGKRIVLSDIPINLEIDSQLASFFKAHDPESLKDAMLAVLSQPEEHFTNDYLIAEGEKRKTELQRVITSMMKETMNS